MLFQGRTIGSAERTEELVYEVLEVHGLGSFPGKLPGSEWTEAWGEEISPGVASRATLSYQNRYEKFRPIGLDSLIPHQKRNPRSRGDRAPAANTPLAEETEFAGYSGTRPSGRSACGSTGSTQAYSHLSLTIRSCAGYPGHTVAPPRMNCGTILSPGNPWRPRSNWMPHFGEHPGGSPFFRDREAAHRDRLSSGKGECDLPVGPATKPSIDPTKIRPPFKGNARS